MNVTVLAEARSELWDAVEYYEIEFRSGDDLLETWISSRERIQIFPQMNAIAYSAPEGVEVRSYKLPRYPYQIIYLCLPESVTILAFAHTSRRPGYWLNRVPE